MSERPGQPRPPAPLAPLEEQAPLHLAELCRLCEVHADLVIEMVSEGLLEPLPSPRGEWLFSPWAAMRVNSALRLRRDLGVNLAGAALALELLEEMHALRRRLRALEERLHEAGRW